ncbi:ribosome small subunit-dependent GTPase A [Rhodococcus sp. NPDC054953]
MGGHAFRSHRGILLSARRYDESDVRVRPGKGSRPRTKKRPEHRSAESAMVVSVDRGRWGCVLGDDPDRPVVAMRARELGRTPIVVGDRVGVVGDVSGRVDTLARIVRVEDRATVLRRTADDTDPYERVVVANASQLLIVVALADPPPRTGFVERALVAAYVGGLDPILCLTKGDLADHREFAAAFEDLDVPVVLAGTSEPLDTVERILAGTVTALIGHSGVGKSTLVNRLVPEADRATGVVSGVGKGRHTSTQSVALPLPIRASALEGAPRGWVIDTPGIRSFGLAHISPDDVMGAFADLASAIEDCPRGCTHLGPPADPECALDRLDGQAARRAGAVRQLLVALSSNETW